MQYLTLSLRLLQERPKLYDQLIQQGTLMALLQRHAQELKDRHEFWMEQLSRSRPGSSPRQIASEAGEIALQELVEALPPVLPPSADEPLSLDAAMAFLTRPTRPA